MTPSDNSFTILPHNLALLHSTLLHSYPVPLRLNCGLVTVNANAIFDMSMFMYQYITSIKVYTVIDGNCFTFNSILVNLLTPSSNSKTLIHITHTNKHTHTHTQTKTHTHTHTHTHKDMYTSTYKQTWMHPHMNVKL